MITIMCRNSFSLIIKCNLKISKLINSNRNSMITFLPRSLNNTIYFIQSYHLSSHQHSIMPRSTSQQTSPINCQLKSPNQTNFKAKSHQKISQLKKQIKLKNLISNSINTKIKKFSNKLSLIKSNKLTNLKSFYSDKICIKEINIEKMHQLKDPLFQIVNYLL